MKPDKVLCYVFVCILNVYGTRITIDFKSVGATDQ